MKLATDRKRRYNREWMRKWCAANPKKARKRSREAARKRRKTYPGAAGRDTARWRKANPKKARLARKRELVKRKLNRIANPEQECIKKRTWRLSRSVKDQEQERAQRRQRAQQNRRAHPRKTRAQDRLRYYAMVCGSHRHLAVVLRSRISSMCRRVKKGRSGSAIRDLGCTLVEFRTYIANQFRPGMTWGNWGRKTWHLDHK